MIGYDIRINKIVNIMEGTTRIKSLIWPFFLLLLHHITKQVLILSKYHLLEIQLEFSLVRKPLF